MNTELTTHSAANNKSSVLLAMADRYGMTAQAFEATVRATCMPGGKEQSVTREQFAAFLLVAKEYGLNPLTKEIYAFPDKRGGITPIVGIDGWANIINSHPAFDGMEFADTIDAANNVSAITCRMHRKDRAHPTEATEYLIECRGQTDPWRRWPRRMLRHKAMIQAARYAFGFAGIYDRDEAERIAGESAKPVQIGRGPLLSRLDAVSAPTPAHDPETGEIIAVFPLDDDNEPAPQGAHEPTGASLHEGAEMPAKPGDPPRQTTPKGGEVAPSAPPSGPDDDDIDPAFDALFAKARAKADGGTGVFSRWHSALSDSDRAMLDRVKPGLMAAAAMATKAADRGAA